MKYFILNKTLDFKRGFSENIAFDQNGIWLEDNSNQSGTFISRVLDSKEKETTWHRIVIRGNSLHKFNTNLTIYATDNQQQEYKGNLWNIYDFIINNEFAIDEKKDFFKQFLKKELYDVTDALIHEVQGRYTWFVLEITGQEKDNIIENIQIYFPKQTWVSYLPEVYEENQKSLSFLERYLSIFQSLYDDLNQEIKEIPKYFNPNVVKGEFLIWLSKWVNVKTSHVWQEDKLRKLLKNAMFYYSIRGTVKSVIELVNLFTGEVPYIVEQHQLDIYRNNHRTIKDLVKLYGDDPFSFTLVVREECIPSNKEYKSLIRILEEVKPAHMSVHMVVIRPYIFLNSYSYLGINSTLGRYRPLALDELSVMQFSTIGTERMR